MLWFYKQPIPNIFAHSNPSFAKVQNQHLKAFASVLDHNLQPKDSMRCKRVQLLDYVQLEFSETSFLPFFALEFFRHLTGHELEPLISQPGDCEYPTHQVRQRLQRLNQTPAMTQMEAYNFGQQKVRAQTLQMVKKHYDSVEVFYKVVNSFVMLVTGVTDREKLKVISKNVESLCALYVTKERVVS